MKRAGDYTVGCCLHSVLIDKHHALLINNSCGYTASEIRMITFPFIKSIFFYFSDRQKMISMNKIHILLLIAATTFLLSSCKKEVDENFQSAEDNAQIETEYSHIYDVVADYASTDSRTGKTDDYILPSGAVVTFTDTTFNDGDGVDFMIDYGPLNHTGSTKGLLCKDGRYRAGKIHVGLSARWSDIPCTITIAISSADEYYSGNGSKMYMITGTKVVERTSDTTFTITITDATLQRDNGMVSWSANREVTLTHDAGLGWLNDEYTVTGSASGTDANGVEFTGQIITPLVKKLSLDCMRTFIAGEVTVTNSNGKVFSINYGDLSCDNTVTITYNGKSRDITLW